MTELIEQMDDPPSLCIDSGARPWIDMVDVDGGAVVIEGRMEIKPLMHDEDSGLNVVMSRMTPGTRTCKHLHKGTVTAYTLTGRWRYLEYDWVATAGSYVHEPAGSVHTLVVDGDEPTVVLFHVTGEIINYDQDGSVLENSGLAGKGSAATEQVATSQAAT